MRHLLSCDNRYQRFVNKRCRLAADRPHLFCGGGTILYFIIILLIALSSNYRGSRRLSARAVQPCRAFYFYTETLAWAPRPSPCYNYLAVHRLAPTDVPATLIVFLISAIFFRPARKRRSDRGASRRLRQRHSA